MDERARGFVSAVVAVVALTSAAPAAAALPAPRLPVVLPLSAAMRALPPDSSGRSPRTYGWPLRPFDAQHAIRGAFGDPRFGARQRNFHFGVDIPAAPWTPVYAVAAGTAFLEPDRVDVLARTDRRHADAFSYWHIAAAVPEHARIRQGELLGWVKPFWGHVHLAELLNGRWVNPLRPGALAPYVDTTRPRIEPPTVSSADEADTPAPIGRDPIDVTVDAWATPPLRPAPPWRDARLAPSLIRWRLLARGAPVSHWRIAVDFRDFIPPNRLFADVYAPGTLPNRPRLPGEYRFYLARDWNVDRLPPGHYTIEAEAVGSRGMSATAASTFDVRRSEATR